jgi:transglutaminase-like putative cysteine protease
MRILPRVPGGTAVALALATVITASACSKSGGERRAETSGAGTKAPAAAPTSAGPLPGPEPLDQASIAALRDASEKLSAATGSDIDVDQKADALGSDVNRLFAFARDEIHVQVYTGVLRGARGTLTGRAGNAWDKAVLLAALLRHHGREVRFARGRLTPDRAAAVVARMFADTARPATRAPVELPASLVARSRRDIAAIEARWRSAASEVQDALGRGGVALGTTAAMPDATLAAEAADHAWIEYHDGDKWIPLDPTGGPAPGDAAAAATETFAQVPEALYHRITFRVKIEQRRGQTLAVRDAFAWRSTAAALHGAGVLFVHRFDRTKLGGWRATPSLVVDGHTYAARSFTAAGLEDARVSNALVSEASRQVRGVGGINELFGGQAPAQSSPAAADLTAEWLDVEFTDPAGPSTSSDVTSSIASAPRLARRARAPRPRSRRSGSSQGFQPF